MTTNDECPKCGSRLWHSEARGVYCPNRICSALTTAEAKLARLDNPETYEAALQEAFERGRREGEQTIKEIVDEAAPFVNYCRGQQSILARLENPDEATIKSVAQAIAESEGTNYEGTLEVAKEQGQVVAQRLVVRWRSTATAILRALARELKSVKKSPKS